MCNSKSCTDLRNNSHCKTSKALTAWFAYKIQRIYVHGEAVVENAMNELSWVITVQYTQQKKCAPRKESRHFFLISFLSSFKYTYPTFSAMAVAMSVNAGP